jgi:hypothetical protein
MHIKLAFFYTLKLQVSTKISDLKSNISLYQKRNFNPAIFYVVIACVRPKVSLSQFESVRLLPFGLQFDRRWQSKLSLKVAGFGVRDICSLTSSLRLVNGSSDDWFALECRGWRLFMQIFRVVFSFVDGIGCFDRPRMVTIAV